MNPVKILFLDIDGTSFYNRIQDALPSTKLAFKKAKEKGIKLVINTSRSPAEMVEIPQSFLAYFDAIICNAGTMIYEKDRLIAYHPIDKESTRKAIEEIEKRKLIYRWTGKDLNYLNIPGTKYEEIFYRLYKMIPPAKKWNGEELVQILFYDDDSRFYEELQSLLPKTTVTHLSIANEITAKNIDKGSSIIDLCKLWNIDVHQTAAFGDGNNDISMIKVAEYGVAMGNAGAKVKENADYVTDSIDNDGLYKAFIHYGWIDE